jgi:hypothetical protein
MQLSIRSKLWAIQVIAFTTAACTSQSATLRNSAGQVVQCKNEGRGWIGASVAMANQSDCIKKANAAGFSEEKGIQNAAPIQPTNPDNLWIRL